MSAELRAGFALAEACNAVLKLEKIFAEIPDIGSLDAHRADIQLLASATASPALLCAISNILEKTQKARS